MGNEAPDRPLRVCFFGTYRANYSRNQIMINGLRAQGATVHECHASLWRGIEDRVDQASGGWRSPSFWWRVLKTYWALVRKHRQSPEYDVMLIGYPGQFDTFLGRLLSWWRRKSMALDHYMSLYLIAEERGLVTKSPFTGKLILWLETLGLHLPDLIISDTREYVQYHCRTYRLAPERFKLVPAGADDRLFYPRPHLQPPSDYFRVIYYGTFIRNHGVPHMLAAIARLKSHAHIRFDFYGEGPEAAEARTLARELDLENVTFHGWIEKEDLPLELAQSHLCFGAFGQTRQSRMTVQNKIWEAAAMKRPIVSGDAPAVREALQDREEIYLVERDDPQALAEAIEYLAAHPQVCERLANRAHQRFLAGNTIAAIGRATTAALRSVLEY